MKDLILIPAMGRTKGIPGKNIKPLNGKPLIYYTLDAAREVASHENIVVSTDSFDPTGLLKKRVLQHSI